MKKMSILLLLCALSTTVAIHAQDSVVYESVFGDSCSVWYIFAETSDHLDAGTNVRQVHDGDTATIDGVNYKCLRNTPYQVANILPLYDNQLLFLRENDNHSKLYFKGYSMPEVLVMDLEMNEGDTLNTHGWSELIQYGFMDETTPQIKIDSIFYNGGRKVLRTNLYRWSWGAGEDTLFFIEGIGPSFGPCYPRQTINSLSCFFKDGLSIYHGKVYDQRGGCDSGWFSSIEERYEDFCKIYPNPTHNVLNIFLSQCTNCNITVRTSSGKLIYDKEAAGSVTTFDIGDCPSGIYLVTIINGEKPFTMKVIKL